MTENKWILFFEIVTGFHMLEIRVLKNLAA